MQKWIQRIPSRRRFFSAFEEFGHFFGVSGCFALCCLRYPFKFQHLLALAWTVAAAFRPSGHNSHSLGVCMHCLKSVSFILALLAFAPA